MQQMKYELSFVPLDLELKLPEQLTDTLELLTVFTK